MSSRWSFRIRETCDLKSDGGMPNKENIEREVCNQIAKEREYREEL